MGKASLVISILIVIFVLAILVLKAKHPMAPAMTSYTPTPAQKIISPSPTPSIVLTITSPTSQTVTTQTVTVSGQTAPNADVFVNDTELTANSQGIFSTMVTLDEGDNTIVIDANDETGNNVEKEISVTYTPN